MKPWRKVVPVIVSASLMVAGAASAWAHDAGKHARFSDLRQAAWAEAAVEQLAALHVIGGYPDGTFQPNKPVTRAEAVALVVRLLGYEAEAKAKAQQAVVLPFRDQASIPLWARGYVAVALEKGIVEPATVFQAQKPATRMDVVHMLMSGLKLNVRLVAKASLSFTDIANLSPEERQKLAIAVLCNLVAGYPDKTFRPNQPVKRAELAVLLERLLDRVAAPEKGAAHHLVRGTVASVDVTANKVTVTPHAKPTDGGVTVALTYTVAQNARVFIGGKAGTLADLKPGMRVRLVLDAQNRVVFIAAKPADEDAAPGLEQAVKGEVAKVDVTNQRLWVTVKGVATVPLQLDPQVIVTVDGAQAKVEDLRAGMRVQLVFSEAGTVVAVSAKRVDSGQEAK